MPTSIAEAGYELSQSAIREQNERLSELRGRAGTLLAAASLAASFLGGQAIRAGDISVLGGLAVAAYLLSIAACIKVLLPHRLVFSFRGSTLIEVARQAQADLDETLAPTTSTGTAPAPLPKAPPPGFGIPGKRGSTTDDQR